MVAGRNSARTVTFAIIVGSIYEPEKIKSISCMIIVKIFAIFFDDGVIMPL